MTYLISWNIHILFPLKLLIDGHSRTLVASIMVYSWKFLNKKVISTPKITTYSWLFRRNCVILVESTAQGRQLQQFMWSTTPMRAYPTSTLWERIWIWRSGLGHRDSGIASWPWLWWPLEVAKEPICLRPLFDGKWWEWVKKNSDFP